MDLSCTEEKEKKSLEAYEHLVPAVEDFLWSTVANRSLFHAIQSHKV